MLWISILLKRAFAQGASEAELIEKIDIGGVALLRAAAKNFKNIWVISSPHQYEQAIGELRRGAHSTSAQRRAAALEAFRRSAGYDTQISAYFSNCRSDGFQCNFTERYPLRYGENAQQEAAFYGPLDELISLRAGKPLSYNNLSDLDAAFDLLRVLGHDYATFVIIKHGNPCGAALDSTSLQAYRRALPQIASLPLEVFLRVISPSIERSLKKFPQSFSRSYLLQRLVTRHSIYLHERRAVDFFNTIRFRSRSVALDLHSTVCSSKAVIFRSRMVKSGSSAARSSLPQRSGSIFALRMLSLLVRARMRLYR